jgi:hypothetical protein
MGHGTHCTHGTSLAESTTIVCTTPGRLDLLPPRPPAADALMLPTIEVVGRPDVPALTWILLPYIFDVGPGAALLGLLSPVLPLESLAWTSATRSWSWWSSWAKDGGGVAASSDNGEHGPWG